MDTKVFWKSRRFWGILITTVSFVAPKYAPLISAAVEPIANIAGSVGEVIGLITTSIGAWRAKEPLSLTTTSTQPPVR